MALSLRLSVSILLTLICTFVTSQRNPNIAYISREQIVNIGGVLFMDCSVQHAQEYPVLWMKLDPSGQSNSLPLSSGSKILLPDNRFDVKYDGSSTTFTLQIKDVQESDAGWYQCQVIISVSHKVTADIHVIVRIPPVIADNSTRSAVATEGTSAKLECYAWGYPDPVIYWKRQDNGILPTGGSIFEGNVLLIPNVRREDRGTYYCIADNGVGRGGRRHINLEVEFSPVVRIPRPRVGQALNYDSDLECHVEAYPVPHIVWVKDGQVLANNMHYQISNFATADEFTDSMLRAVTVEKKQYGKYFCRAKNKLGAAESVAELYETVVPVCPPACVDYQSSASSITYSVALMLIILIISQIS